jgi:hypothetical protein
LSFVYLQLTISAEIARLQAELSSLDSHDAQPLTLSALLLADPFAAPPPSTASEKIRIRHSELKLEAFEKHLLSITQHVHSLDKEIDAVRFSHKIFSFRFLFPNLKVDWLGLCFFFLR